MLIYCSASKSRLCNMILFFFLYLNNFFFCSFCCWLEIYDNWLTALARVFLWQSAHCAYATLSAWLPAWLAARLQNKSLNQYFVMSEVKNCLAAKHVLHILAPHCSKLFIFFFLNKEKFFFHSIVECNYAVNCSSCSFVDFCRIIIV